MAEKDKPKIYDVRSHKVCEHCKYYYSHTGCCGFYFETGKLRTVSKGKIRLPKGKCDKFTKGKVDTAARREAFLNGKL